MNKQMSLFVGLGNPGQKYENTRHNFGFVVLDEIAESKHLKFKTWDNIAEISFYKSNNGKVWFLKPMTFMNLSGDAISSFAKYYKITSEEIFVFYDDFSIPLGEYKIRMSGSSGGHNGINSIIEHMHTGDFPRMKLGIGPLLRFMNAADFVLSQFSQEDREKINLIKKISVKVFDEICISGLDKTISRFANIKL
ncbi:MAG: aminoacyl-tRNA hydrolase [Endomicrobium sp.]|jgi:PTH1 family peptidyl-tRNA hydrolase|nr:aminoacyl-tRNA hydrolase [Endomicrobium sp.]